MTHSFHPEAVEEYLGAVSYYAAIGPPLAESFIRAIEEGIEEILMFLEAWQIVEEDVRLPDYGCGQGVAQVLNQLGK